VTAGGRSALVAVAVALALGAHSMRGLHRLQASVLLRLVQRQMAALGGAQPPGPLLRAAEGALRQAHQRDPAAVEPLSFEADLLLVAGRLADADRAYRRAASHEAPPEVLFNWGLALWRRGDTEAAVVQLRRAVALSPPLVAQLPEAARPAVTAAPLLPIPPLDPRAAPP
jgi:Tfp pilus assembly protein PilF